MENEMKIIQCKYLAEVIGFASSLAGDWPVNGCSAEGKPTKSSITKSTQEQYCLAPTSAEEQQKCSGYAHLEPPNNL